MRSFRLLIIPALLLAACAKQKTKDPVPRVDFIDLRDAHKSKFTGSDTATIVLSYEDGDGDIFVDDFSNDPNLIITPYHYNTTTKTFEASFNAEPTFNDTIRQPSTIKQPDNGYYKGKSIKGEIYVPLSSFRENNTQKIIKFTGFMIDMAGHKSNVFSSPAYTLTF